MSAFRQGNIKNCSEPETDILILESASSPTITTFFCKELAKRE